MRIIVGLGNPGPQYMGTRHNAGVDFVDRLVSSQFTVHGGYGWRKNYGALVFKTPSLVLVKTRDVFMNESGRLLQSLNPIPSTLDTLYVAHDDLDLRLGEYKIQKGVGPKLHYGVQSIEQALGTTDFWRIRIGVDNRIPNTEYRIPGEEYVLEKFMPQEKQVIDQVLEKIADEINKANS